MQGVTVEKARLKAKLEENRTAHVEAFDAIWAAFQKTAESRAAMMLQEIRAAKQGERISLSLSLVVPENHEDDYTRAITMLDFEVGDEVHLHQQEFAQLVLDDWGWKQQFRTTGMAYMGESSALPGIR